MAMKNAHETVEKSDPIDQFIEEFGATCERLAQVEILKLIAILAIREEYREWGNQNYPLSQAAHAHPRPLTAEVGRAVQILNSLDSRRALCLMEELSNKLRHSVEAGKRL